jgi:hypothetical protein
MQRGLKTMDGEVGPLVLNALVSGRAMVLGTHTVSGARRAWMARVERVARSGGARWRGTPAARGRPRLEFMASSGSASSGERRRRVLRVDGPR